MKPRYTLTFYRTTDGYRWRLRARNHEIIAASTQGYTRRIDARTNARQATLYHLRPGVRVEVER